MPGGPEHPYAGNGILSELSEVVILYLAKIHEGIISPYSANIQVNTTGYLPSDFQEHCSSK